MEVGGGGLGVTAKGCGISSWGNGNVQKCIVVMVAQLCKPPHCMLEMGKLYVNYISIKLSKKKKL